jgi:hypothetical protein
MTVINAHTNKRMLAKVFKKSIFNLDSIIDCNGLKEVGCFFIFYIITIPACTVLFTRAML